MSDGSNPRTDIALALFLVVVCSVVLFQTRLIPAGTFEPLGSAPVPQATAGLIILLSLVMMARAVLVLARGREKGPPADDEVRPWDAAAVLGLTVLYIAAMQARLLDFAFMSAIFLFITIGFLVRFRTRLLPAIAAVALITGFGCQYLFTRIFVVDLPGL